MQIVQTITDVDGFIIDSLPFILDDTPRFYMIKNEDTYISFKQWLLDNNINIGRIQDTVLSNDDYVLLFEESIGGDFLIKSKSNDIVLHFCDTLGVRYFKDNLWSS